MIKPSHPFERGEFHGFPRCAAKNQFRLVKTVDGFGQRIVVAVVLAADRRFDSGFGQTLGVANGDILRSPIRMMNQGGIAFWLSSIKRLFQRVEDKISPHRTAEAPTHNPARKDVEYEGDIDESLPHRDVCKVRDPQLILPVRLELSIDVIEQARRDHVCLRMWFG